jgi:hypothetical protein
MFRRVGMVISWFFRWGEHALFAADIANYFGLRKMVISVEGGLLAAFANWPEPKTISPFGIVMSGLAGFAVTLVIINGVLSLFNNVFNKELPSKLEIVLKSIHIGFDEMGTNRWVTIDISMHNSSGMTLRTGNIIGHIELRPMTSLPQWLDSPTFLANTTNNIPPWSDFHIILKQKFPKQAADAAMAAWDQGRIIQLKLSELQISVSGNENMNVSLPLWYGATVEKIGQKYLTAELGTLQ